MCKASPEAIDAIDQYTKRTAWRDGYSAGRDEVIATLIAHGEAHIAGCRVTVTFAFEDERNERIARTLCDGIIQRGRDAGRLA